MSTPRILAFGGSLRSASFNQQLAALAADGARHAGAEVTLLALRDFPLPLFDQDIEDKSGMPERAAYLKALFARHDGLIIASPEYNGSFSAALKNAIDWVSRATEPDEAPLKVLAGKKAVLLAASPGGYGGARGLKQLREFLGNIRIEVVGDDLTVPKVHELVDEAGTIMDQGIKSAAAASGAALALALR
jgi:NAD(P)H-dependent FMN reductase